MLSPFLNLNQGYNSPYFKLFFDIIKKIDLKINRIQKIILYNNVLCLKQIFL